MPSIITTELQAVRTVSQVLAVADQYPTLGKLRAANGPAKVEALIKAYLMQLTDLVNVARPLNEAKINAIAQRIVANYAVLTVADIHYVFNAAINGHYGNFYESLDVPKVMTWFATYFDERCRTAAEISQAEAISDKGGNFTAKYATRLLDRLQSRNSNPHK